MGKSVRGWIHLQIGSNNTCPSLLQACVEKSRDIISNTKMSQNSHKSYNVSFRCFKNSNVQYEWNSFYVLFKDFLHIILLNPFR